MKRIFVPVGISFVILWMLSTSIPAANDTEFAAPDTIMKISMSSMVKRAKEFGSGNGIEITLPILNDSKFNIYAVELAVFEKMPGNSIWHIYKDKSGAESKRQLISEPHSLKIQIDFGDVGDYRVGAKYKIAYRYHVQSAEDASVIVIAGQDTKDGWRLAGETNSIVATEQGFLFYPNAAPKVSIDSIRFFAEDIDGVKTLEYSADEIEDIWLPKDVLEKGIQLKLTATDSDPEDDLTILYTLTDPKENNIISQGIYSPGNLITSNTRCEYVQLTVTATDNWGASLKTKEVSLKIDQNPAEIIEQFDDKGKILRGKNLYSKFTISDRPGEPLSQGNAYYSIIRDGITLYNNVAFPNNENGTYTVDLSNMADGEYHIVLTLFDKAHNKTTHTLRQELDNTPPTVTFLTPEQNSAATLYSTWMNVSKKIIVSVMDSGAGIKSCSRYLDNLWQGSLALTSMPNTYTFSFDVATDKTGKLYYHYYFYDNAHTVDKANNTASTVSNGNSTQVSRYVWLDKTPPVINIDADENTWYDTSSAISAFAHDYPSDFGVFDNSGVKEINYCISDSEEPGANWGLYPSGGVKFSSGGIYYLHVKAKDYAGNESVETKKIKVNSKSLILSGVSPTDDYAYTIYNRTNHNGKGVYVVKNTAYNTKYRFSLQDDDINDTIKTHVRLVNTDNSSIYAETQTETHPTGNTVRDIVFNMPYISDDGRVLPDGVYTMQLTISELKSSGESITTYSDVIGCEVVIKRTPPPAPQITVSDLSGGQTVSIQYPTETLAEGLNHSYITSLYKREYKVVEDGIPASNAYYTYTMPIAPITKDCVITALYTDCAGNVSTSSLRIFAYDEDAWESIQTDGNMAAVEEGRSSTTYYIGTRRDKQSGIDTSILNFL